jgi:hypothetical protein
MSGFPFPSTLPIVDSRGIPLPYFYNWLVARDTFSGTVVTAKLTTGGANGSMTFVNGQLTKEVKAT